MHGLSLVLLTPYDQLTQSYVSTYTRTGSQPLRDPSLSFTNSGRCLLLATISKDVIEIVVRHSVDPVYGP